MTSEHLQTQLQQASAQLDQYRAALLIQEQRQAALLADIHRLEGRAGLLQELLAAGEEQEAATPPPPQTLPATDAAPDTSP